MRACSTVNIFAQRCWRMTFATTNPSTRRFLSQSAGCATSTGFKGLSSVISNNISLFQSSTGSGATIASPTKPICRRTLLAGVTNVPIPTIGVVQIRAFATKKDKSKKKKKNSKLDTSSSNSNNDVESAPAKQLEGWIEFQKSIAVKGFETGQTVDIQRKSSRGGKRLSKRKSKEQIRLEERMKERQRMTDIGGGEFPPLRYSDEETERLLAQAYAAIPPRTGKRGTRNLKRQKRRWRLVREIRKKYKKNIIRAHFRRMEERSRRIQSVKAVLSTAPDILSKDRQYQITVLERWMATVSNNDSSIQHKQRRPLLGSDGGGRGNSN